MRMCRVVGHRSKQMWVTCVDHLQEITWISTGLVATWSITGAGNMKVSTIGARVFEHWCRMFVWRGLHNVRDGLRELVDVSGLLGGTVVTRRRNSAPDGDLLVARHHDPRRLSRLRRAEQGACSSSLVACLGLRKGSKRVKHLSKTPRRRRIRRRIRRRRRKRRRRRTRRRTRRRAEKERQTHQKVEASGEDQDAKNIPEPINDKHKDTGKMHTTVKMKLNIMLRMRI